MNIAVRYFSRNGNTRRLAEAIAEAAGVRAASVAEPLTGRAELLFLGSSVYAGRPSPEVTDFIKRQAADIGRVVVFSTSASGKSTHAAIKAVAADCGVPVSEMFFHCPGAFWFLHKNRPGADDCRAAAEFARRQIEAMEEMGDGREA